MVPYLSTSVHLQKGKIRKGRLCFSDVFSAWDKDWTGDQVSNRKQMVGMYQIYLDCSQILLFLWWSLMDKTQPIRMAGIACIQDIKYFTFTATNLKHFKIRKINLASSTSTKHTNIQNIKACWYSANESRIKQVFLLMLLYTKYNSSSYKKPMGLNGMHSHVLREYVYW